MLVYCFRGSVEYDLSGTAYRLEAGDSLLFEANLNHHWHNRGSSAAAFLLVFESGSADLVRRHLPSWSACRRDCP